MTTLFVARNTYSKLHALCTSGSQLPRHNNLTPLGPTLHNEPQHTITGSPDSQPVQQLVAKRFTLSNGRETTILDFSGIEGDGVLGELEAFLDERCELADATPLLAEDFLGVCCADDWMYFRTRGIGTGWEGGRVY